MHRRSSAAAPRGDMSTMDAASIKSALMSSGKSGLGSAAYLAAGWTSASWIHTANFLQLKHSLKLRFTTFVLEYLPSVRSSKMFPAAALFSFLDKVPHASSDIPSIRSRDSTPAVVTIAGTSSSRAAKHLNHDWCACAPQ